MVNKLPNLLVPQFQDEESEVVHYINTGDSIPCRSKVRPLQAGSKKAILGKEAWQELVDLKIVEPVDLSQPTTWSSPLHLQLKANGKYRCCGDFRLLNLRTLLDTFPLPSLRAFSDDIKGSTIFSKVDLRKAFHQILIDPRDRHKTCVTTPWGLFNFKRLAMGMQNSAQSDGP